MKSKKELCEDLFHRINYVEKQVKELRNSSNRDPMFRCGIYSISVFIRAICFDKKNSHSLLVSSEMKDSIFFDYIIDSSATEANLCGWNKLCEMEISTNHFYSKAKPF